MNRKTGNAKSIITKAVIGRSFDTDSDVMTMTFQQLNQRNQDIGFTTSIINGKDYHHVTRDITLSLQKFHDGNLINLLYTNGKPFKVQLSDEVIPYYSDFIEWRYVVNGHLELEFDKTAASFEENEICFINSSVLHREFIRNSECTIINISIDRAFFNERFISNIALSPLQKFIRTNILRKGNLDKYIKFAPKPEDVPEIQEYLFAILKEAREQKVGYQDICRGYIIRLMDKLSSGYRRNLTKSEMNKYHDSLFESISDYMKQNLSVVTMDALTAEFFYKTNSINDLVKKYTGLTYSNYLISLRIEKAKELLETTDMKIDDIVWSVGYHNKGFFYKRFYEATGCNLAEYRNANRKA